MTRVFTCVMVSLLVLSTICSAVCLRYDGEFLSMVTDLSEENEQEIEAYDFRHLIDHFDESGKLRLYEEKQRFCYAEALNFKSFLEVPFPPPKG